MNEIENFYFCDSYQARNTIGFSFIDLTLVRFSILPEHNQLSVNQVKIIDGHLTDTTLYSLSTCSSLNLNPKSTINYSNSIFLLIV